MTQQVADRHIVGGAVLESFLENSAFFIAFDVEEYVVSGYYGGQVECYAGLPGARCFY